MTYAKQLYTLINAVSNMALGNNAVTVSDTSSLVSLGRAVMSTDQSINAFYNSLANVIGKTYTAYRALPENRLGLMRDPLEFGLILRSLTVSQIARAVNNDSWKTGTWNREVHQDTTNAVAEYYESHGTFEIEVKVVYDFQLKGAFESEGAMNAFVDMIFKDMYNGMELAIRDLENLTVSTAAAVAGSHELDKQTCINLLASYNTDFNKTLTAAAAWRDPDFLRYSAAEIKKHCKYMQDPSVFYNAKGYERWTTSDRLQLHVIEQYAANLATYLQSNTYHEELVKLNGYKERGFWQGVGDNSLAERTKICIKNGDLDVLLDGVLAFAFDYDAAGITIDYVRTKSEYMPKAEHTEYYHKADWGAFVKQSEQGVVFYISDYQPIPAEEPADWSTNYNNYYYRNILDEIEKNTSSTFDDSKQYYRKVN